MIKEILGEFIVIKNANKDLWYGREHIGQVYRVVGGNDYSYYIRDGRHELRVLIDDVEKLTPLFYYDCERIDKCGDCKYMSDIFDYTDLESYSKKFHLCEHPHGIENGMFEVCKDCVSPHCPINNNFE